MSIVIIQRTSVLRAEADSLLPWGLAAERGFDLASHRPRYRGSIGGDENHPPELAVGDVLIFVVELADYLHGFLHRARTVSVIVLQL